MGFQRTAEVLMAETGADTDRFPNTTASAELGTNVSGQRRERWQARKGKTGGQSWPRAALIDAGYAAAHTKRIALAARFRRVMSHRGHKKAAVAVGR